MTESGEKGAEKMRQSRRQFEIREFLLILVPKLPLLLFGAVVGAALAGMYVSLCLAPLYSATAKLYIFSRSAPEDAVLAFKTSTIETEDYQEVFRTQQVCETVRRELKLDFSYEQMRSRLTVANPDKTRTVYITFAHESAGLAAEIANAYARAGKAFIQQKMRDSAGSTLSVALVPGEASGMGRKSYFLLGGIWGGACSVTILFFRFSLDDRPKTPRDIQKAAQIPTLCVLTNADKKDFGKGGAGRG